MHRDDSEVSMRIFTTPRRRSRRTLVSATAALATLLALGGVGSATAAVRPAAHHPAASAPSTRLTPFTIVSPDFQDGGPLPVWTEFGGTFAADAGCFGKNL